MSETAMLVERIEKMTSAVASLTDTVMQLTRTQGARLSRKQVCERLDVCSKTLTAMLRRGDVPEPCADGQWLLADLVEWEQRQPARRHG